MLDKDTPFHPGELAAQARAGAGDIALRAAPFIRDFMPDQHRAFYEAQPFFVAAASDDEGRVWTTIVEGPDGFVQSPDARTLEVQTQMDASDPLAAPLQSGTDIGLIGIELATRRRNRLSGRTRRSETGFAIDIRQSFGNCPQYISERNWWRVDRTQPADARHAQALDPEQIARIAAADTMFIGSGQRRREEAASNGFDASHRGGAPGFVRVLSPTRLRIPDYAGNNFFNTIGNLMEDPRIGLLFVDFSTGGLLHLSGRATIDWTPGAADDSAALRVIEVAVEAVIDRPMALSLRWDSPADAAQKFVVTNKVKEAEDITSFLLTPADGRGPAPFAAGQHLPVILDVPGQANKVQRSYSLSGPPAAPTYRITVKRDPNGIASRFLHDTLEVGDVITANPPAGDFGLPKGDGPLVLVSAGVGLTPLLAMLHHVAASGRNRKVWFVHGARNGRHHALQHEVARLVAAAPQVQARLFYSAPDAADRTRNLFDAEGRITARDLLALKAGPKAQYVLCGPSGFVADLQSGLEAGGVPAGQIQFETFG